MCSFEYGKHWPYESCEHSCAYLDVAVVLTGLGCVQSDTPGQDLQALTRASQSWATLFAHAPIRELLPCIARLIKPPLGSPAVAQLFGPHLLAAVGRAILSEETSLVAVGMPLLVNLCCALSPQGAPAQQAAMPVILTAANQEGFKMAGFIKSLIQTWPGKDLQMALTDKAGVALTWAAVQCLPHADSNPKQSIKLLQDLITATEDAQSGSPSSDATSSSDRQQVLFLQSYARGTLASLLAAYSPEALQQQAENALWVLHTHPHDFHVVRCTAEVVSLAKEACTLFSPAQLQVRHLRVG